MIGKWWTWNSDFPCEVSHLESGFAVATVLYSAKRNAANILEPANGVTLGRRPVGDTSIGATLDHAETRIAWSAEIAQPGALRLGWHALTHGEWGLRFWFLLVLRHLGGAEIDYDAASGIATTRDGHWELAVDPAPHPPLITAHDSIAALRTELEDKGYFYLGSRGGKGACVALRFTLEDGAPAICRFTVQGKKAATTGATAPGAVATPADVPAGLPTDPRIEAIHDVLSWLHVYDFKNRRPYTGLSRFWNSKKFGGHGIWLNDVLYNAMLWGMFDLEKALANLRAVFSLQTADGNFPCLVTGNDAWLDRTQPPISAFVVWSLYLRTGDQALLELAYPHLRRNYDWWFRRRLLPGMGLVGFGTSLEVGSGLYKGTKFAAKNESQMDNSPIHDEAPFDPATGMLLSADVGVNSMLALEGEILCRMAALVQPDDSSDLRERTERHKAAIASTLWDPSRGIFANRLVSGAFVRALAPTSFYPMVAGVSSPEQDRRMIEEHLLDPRRFGGDFVLPAVSRDDPAYADNVYWRGRIWPPLNFWVYHGLHRTGHGALARDLAAKSYALFHRSWAHRICAENFNAETGVALDQPDTDRFFSFGTLLPAIAAAEALDFTPWHGWSLAHPGETASVGPILTPAGIATVRSEGESWSFETVEGGTVFRTNLRGRITHIEIAGDHAVFLIPAQPRASWIAFPARGFVAGTCGDEPLIVDGERFLLPQRGTGARLSFDRKG